MSTLGFHQLCDLTERFLVHTHAGGIAGIDDEKGLDLRILQLLDFVIGVLEAVLLGRFDVHDLEVVVLKVRHLDIRREDRRAEGNGVAGEARCTSPTSDTHAQSVRCGPACDREPDNCRR